MKLRNLQDFELEDMLPLAELFHAESGVVSTFCPEMLLKTVRSNKTVVIGMFDGTTLVGVLLAMLAQQYITTAVLAQEMMWYVKPSYRGNPVALKMFEMFEQWGKDHKAYALLAASLTTSSPSVPKLYRRLGYTEIETHHLKIL